MKKYGLVRKPDNFRFFDPQSKLHLTLEKPVGQASQETSGIKRGIDSNTIMELGVSPNTKKLAVQAVDPSLVNEMIKKAATNMLPGGLPDLTKQTNGEPPADNAEGTPDTGEGTDVTVSTVDGTPSTEDTGTTDPNQDGQDSNISKEAEVVNVEDNSDNTENQGEAAPVVTEDTQKVAPVVTEPVMVAKYEAGTLTNDYKELQELAKAESIDPLIKKKEEIKKALLAITVQQA